MESALAHNGDASHQPCANPQQPGLGLRQGPEAVQLRQCSHMLPEQVVQIRIRVLGRPQYSGYNFHQI
ncbi:hypothetical protein D3C75_1314710 [compost metagenome]